MSDSRFEKDAKGQTRTLYSLRHTFATLDVIENSMDIHTLAKQIGSSATMIERHYSKLTVVMAAAWRA
jgi:integrase